MTQRPITAGLLLFAAILAAQASGQDVPSSPSVGTIEGTVTYQTDTARPWRYSRYYIKQPKTGEMAEAVVALRAKPTNDPGREPQTVVIDQQNFQFLPETVAIRRGDSVKFTNADQATHNVQATTDIATFNVNMPGGGHHLVRFDRPGGIRQPIQIGCVFHSAMRAWIFVFDHPWYQITPPSGKFRLDSVPPGPYELEVVHPAGDLRWRKRIEVKPGEPLRIDIRLSADDKM
jgi:plastocyanin